MVDGLERIESGYWSENVGSAKVQSKLGFSLLGRGPLLCLARGCELEQQYTRLTRLEAAQPAARQATPKDGRHGVNPR